MPETTALGAAVVAGAADGVNVWTVEKADVTKTTTDTFTPTTSDKGERRSLTLFDQCCCLQAGIDLTAMDVVVKFLLYLQREMLGLLDGSWQCKGLCTGSLPTNKHKVMTFSTWSMLEVQWPPLIKIPLFRLPLPPPQNDCPFLTIGATNTLLSIHSSAKTSVHLCRGGGY